MIEVLEVGILDEETCIGVGGSQADLFLTLCLVEENFELKEPESIADGRLLRFPTVLAGLSGDHVH